MDIAEFLHFGTIALAIGINSIGVGIGEGMASSGALDAINMQPEAQSHITRAALIGMALIETAAIMGISISIILLLGTKNATQTIYVGIAEIGIALAICISGFVIGIVSSLPTQAACYAIARQPFFAQKIIRLMLITQAIIQTPIVFGFIIAMFINNQAPFISSMADSLRLLASGLCIGLGGIGPAIGLALFAQTACKGLGINPQAYNKLLSFTFISQAIIETPIIFALVISLLLIITTITSNNVVEGIAMLAAGLCTGIGTFGPGISSGKTASAACHQIAINPELHGKLSKVSIFAQGLIDTAAIYALLISLLLIFFR